MRQDLTTGPVTRTMLLFALPMILGNILQQCYNLADTWIVGRFISTDALGAVGSAYTLMTFLTSLILGMCMGAGALFSISYGGKDLRRLGEYIASAFVLIVGLTVVLTGVSYGLLPSILRWMRTPEDVYPMMYAYVQVILVGLPFIFLYNYFAFLLRAVGNSLVPLVFLGVSTVLNIGLDVLLVAVIPYGVAGAAAATVIAQGVAGVGIAVFRGVWDGSGAAGHVVHQLAHQFQLLLAQGNHLLRHGIQLGVEVGASEDKISTQIQDRADTCQVFRANGLFPQLKIGNHLRGDV